MDVNQEKPLKVELNTLNDYHRRLIHLLERMERLEASLNTLPLASRVCNIDAEDKNTQEGQQRIEDNADVETEPKEDLEKCEEIEESMDD